MHAMRPKTDAEQGREIARDIVLALIAKTGVQEYDDARTMKNISQRAIESARYIIEQFPQPRRD